MVYSAWSLGPAFGGTSAYRLRRELDRLLDAVAGSTDGGAWTPSVDVCEADDQVMIDFELPGVRPENVELTIENGMLTVSGEKRAIEQDDKQRRYHMAERSYGSFFRSFTLPQGIDENRITADFGDGVLHVHIPKDALPKPRHIEISDGRTAGDRTQLAAEARSESRRIQQPQGEHTSTRAASERGKTSSRQEDRDRGRGNDRGSDDERERMVARGRSEG